MESKMTIVKTKSWGNSIGIIIPAETTKEMGLTAGEDLTMIIQRKADILKEWNSFGKKNPMKKKMSIKKMILKTRKELGVE
jgi:antitoxin component of MazEF toxin-antitoxin module